MADLSITSLNRVLHIDILLSILNCIVQAYVVQGFRKIPFKSLDSLIYVVVLSYYDRVVQKVGKPVVS